MRTKTHHLQHHANPHPFSHPHATTFRFFHQDTMFATKSTLNILCPCDECAKFLQPMGKKLHTTKTNNKATQPTPLVFPTAKRPAPQTPSTPATYPFHAKTPGSLRCTFKPCTSHVRITSSSLVRNVLCERHVGGGVEEEC
ncbi:hypothetical protein CC86DRAFT_53206 [Ophiobolus disseminans]|uniref:Uncharacterized protein n=1 Tax=Ophiobolus disseminans TaxID=1469910 RepID=A0A6A6ZT90_9PLEO|nr:hypothetical protein CC86DRAFT_53206 [Ophiobolus disseminans]